VTYCKQKLVFTANWSPVAERVSGKDNFFMFRV